MLTLEDKIRFKKGSEFHFGTASVSSAGRKCPYGSRKASEERPLILKPKAAKILNDEALELLWNCEGLGAQLLIFNCMFQSMITCLLFLSHVFLLTLEISIDI